MAQKPQILHDFFLECSTRELEEVEKRA